MKDILVPIIGVLSTLVMLVAPRIPDDGSLMLPTVSKLEGVEVLQGLSPKASITAHVQPAKKSVTTSIFFSSSYQTVNLKG